jgi:hypothetical protein
MFLSGFRLFAVQVAMLESLSVPRPDASAHRAGDKDHESQGSIVHLRSDMVTLKDKRRCCQPESNEGIQPTHPESMQGMHVTERSQHKQEQTRDCVIPSNHWLPMTQNEGRGDKPNPRKDINAARDVNLAEILF